jgi:hypothetical protein
MQNLRGSTTTRCPPCVRLPRIQRTHVSSEHDSGSRDILTGFVTRTERSEHGLWLVSGTAIFGNMDASDGLGVVPAHTYARLRFDEAAEQAVTHLGYVLQMHQGSPYQGQFVAQSEQRAGAFFFVSGTPGGRRNPIHARDRCESNQFVMMGMRDDWGPRTTLGCRLRS